jgi:hypothetical protein
MDYNTIIQYYEITTTHNVYITERKKHNKNTTHKSKWTTFTYIGKETRIITKLWSVQSLLISGGFHAIRPQL